MKRLALALLLLLPTAALANTPHDAAEAFYKAYLKAHVLDVPSAKQRKPFKPVVTPKLYKLLEQADAAEALYAKKTNFSSPPLLEGDIFTSNVEGASGYRVGACKQTGGVTAECAISLTFKDAAKYALPSKPKPQHSNVAWLDTLYLTQSKGNWKADDIGYGATWDFGNHGKLADTLQSIIKDAQDQAQQ